MPAPRRFKAPAGNGDVLADPGFDAVPALVEANRRRLDRADVIVGGLPLRELRTLARREVLEVASPPIATGGLAPDAPLLLAGHQPELSHPGVWVKHFALNGLARRVGGVPLNLVVDNDTLKSAALRFPGLPADGPKVWLESIPFDRLDGEVPYEDRTVLDPATFRTFAGRAADVWRDWGYTPLLPQVWDCLVGWDKSAQSHHAARGDGGTAPSLVPPYKARIGEMFTAVRTCFEQKWGCHNIELPVSRLSGTDAFARFARHILGDLPRFRDVYNAAIRVYRAANGVRSANHPAPELGPDEAPFWVRSTDGRRKRATSASDPRSLRPRALTLTLFARVCLGDFFIHGIGGGKYDEVTDTIIRDYFGVEPPAYQVLSATLHLPLSRAAATDADVTRATRRVRDLHWNPQRHLTPDQRDQPEVQQLLAEKHALAKAEPPYREHAARREWFRRLQAVTERLRPLVADQAADAEAALRADRAEAQANAILQRRDYSWVLYPEETLRPFLQRFLKR